MKKIIALILVLAVSVSLCACGFDFFGLFKKDLKDMEPAEAMELVMQKTAEVKSVSMEGEMELTMSLMAQSVDMKMDYKTETTTNPTAVHMIMTMDMSSLGGESQEIETYTVKEGDEFVSYANSGDGWTKTEADSPESIGAPDASAYMEDVASYELLGEEEINGETALHYSGRIDQDKLADVLSSSGAMDAFGDMGIDGNDPDMFKNLGDIVLEVWVSEDSSLPVRYRMDMTEIMNNLFAKMFESLGVQMTVSNVVMVFDVTGYNNVPAITVPEEALNAA